MGGQVDKTPKKRICTGLLAHVDAGKTTLSEAILYQTGAIRKLGRVDQKSAYLDTYAMERARGITIFSKQAEVSVGDLYVTLLDTPGHVDFSAEMERTLQVLDVGILVINGSDGVQGHTLTLWRLLKRYRIPVFLFVNKMDQPGTDRAALLADLKKRLDGAVMDFTEMIGQSCFMGESGGNDRNDPGDGAAKSGEPVLEGTFAEEAAVCDEELLEEYLETGLVTGEQIRRAVGRRKIFPCFFGSALKLFGVEELLKGLEIFGPRPEYQEAFGAKVFKISRDELGNRLTHLKVTGGVLKVKDLLGGPEGEKINQIRIYSGAKFETVSQAEAGMVCAVTGPVSTRPGQGFGAEEETRTPLLEPVLTYQILLPSGTDPNKALKNLRQIEEEDPMLHIIWDEVLGEIKAQVMGDVQMDVLKAQMEERFAIEIGFGNGRIVYKETLEKTVEGVGHFEPLRHYAEVHLLMEPGDPGSGLTIGTDCSEDLLDRNWQRLILTHLEEKRYRGVLTGAEITDIKITLIAGRAHVKHTEGGDFRQATYRAVRQGLKEGGCRLLEPWYSFRLEIPAENLGRAMADIDRMQGKFEAPGQEGDLAVLTGTVPVAGMRDYQREVAAYTRGHGRLSMSLKGYEPCHNPEEVIAEIGYDFDGDLQDPAGSVFCSHGAGMTVPWNEVKKYMHVESLLERRNRLDAEPEPSSELSGSKRNKKGGKPLSASYYEDKELEEIFIRTYGQPKKRTPEKEGARRVIRAEKKNAPEKQKTAKNPEEEYLLVDGYNIIFAWEELSELAKISIDGARCQLMDILCNYQGYKKCTLIVVFDAYKVIGNPGEAWKYHNIHVVYTKEAETADQYIEKLAHRMGRERRVTVATSDGLEQLIIRSQGCHLLSARDFKEEVERVGSQIREETEKFKGKGKNYLLSHADEEIRNYLEQVRLGGDGQ